MDKAEKLLLELPRLSGDPTIIWVELHLRRSERDQAVAALQKRLLHLTQQMQTCMVCLLDEKLGFPLETSMEINRVIQQFESLFFHRTQLSGIMQVELFRRYGQTRQMIESLCDYLDGLNESSPPPNEILYKPRIRKPIGNCVKLFIWQSNKCVRTTNTSAIQGYVRQ